MSATDPYEFRVRSSLRRSACDRCRSLKLKCLRDGNIAQRCLRCIRAAAECLTGPARPLGRASRAAAPAESRQREKHHGVDVPNFSNMDWSHCGDIDASDSTLYSNDLLSSLGFFDNTLVETNVGDATFLSHIETPTSSMTTQNITREIIESSGKEESIFSSGSSDDPDTDIYDAWNAGLHFCRLNLTLAEQLAYFTTNSWETTLKSMAYAHDGAEVSDSAGSARQSNPLREVLRLTFEFVSNIQQYLPPQQPSPLHHQAPSQSSRLELSSPQSIMTSSPDDSGPSMPSFLSFPWPCRPPTQSTQPQASVITPTQSAASTEAGAITTTPELSIVAIPNLLSCYLHLVAIFGVFFRHMHMFLTRMPASSVSVLQTIPYLRLADLQVEHGGLQMKILIQVVEHQLGTIETVLGLPDEHRVFTRHDEPCLHNVPTICLDGRNVGTLLTDVMGNSVAASATRIVASLREEMAKVRHLL